MKKGKIDLLTLFLNYFLSLAFDIAGHQDNKRQETQGGIALQVATHVFDFEKPQGKLTVTYKVSVLLEHSMAPNEHLMILAQYTLL